MTKKEEIIDETLQILAYSDDIPLKYKDLKKIMDNYLIKEKKQKKIKKNIEKQNTDIKQTYENFINEHLKKKLGLQEILDLWQIRRNNLSI
tara:strand:+ start:949 stop:1221 length:273 start_codon:yes stop_codon:yes gene_type:complete